MKKYMQALKGQSRCEYMYSPSIIPSKEKTQFIGRKGVYFIWWDEIKPKYLLQLHTLIKKRQREYKHNSVHNFFEVISLGGCKYLMRIRSTSYRYISNLYVKDRNGADTMLAQNCKFNDSAHRLCKSLNSVDERYRVLKMEKNNRHRQT